LVEIYVNGKMVPAETSAGMVLGKENGGGMNSSIIDVIYCQRLCKHLNVPPPSTTIQKIK
jgi:hypothetical protein